LSPRHFPWRSGLLLLIPLALLLVAAPPRRPALVLVGAFLLAFVLVGQSGDVLWWFGRGWALMLGALFLVITVLKPESSFLDRALGTVFGTVLGTAGLLAVRSGWTSLDLTVAQKLRDSASPQKHNSAPRSRRAMERAPAGIDASGGRPASSGIPGAAGARITRSAGCGLVGLASSHRAGCESSVGTARVSLSR
jgi:hypothetical protein